MAAASIGECLSFGVDFVKKNPLPAILGIIIVSVVNGVSSGILAGPMTVGFFLMVKKHAEGQSPEIGDIFLGFQNHLVPGIVAGILGSLLVAVAFFICIVPGWILIPVSHLALFLVMRGEEDGIEALKRAWKLHQKNLLMGTVTVAVLLIVASLGVIVCGLGMLVTVPLAIAGMYHYFASIDDRSADPTPVSAPPVKG